MKKFLFVIMTLMVFPLAWAAKASLYQVEVPVSAQTADIKEQAVSDGFAQVLVKVSGDPEILNNPVIKPNLYRADYYVSEISYSAPTTTSSQFQLRVRYDVADVNRLLKKAGAASWSDTRPVVLIWLAVSDKKENTQVIDSETTGSIYDAVKREASKYGIPLVLPVMDVSDLDQVTPTDIKKLALPVLKEASKRYAPDALLIGYIDENNVGADSEWHLLFGNDEWKWAFSEKSSQDAIAQVMSQITQTFSKHYAAKKAVILPAIWLKLDITNITQYDDIASIVQYLKKLPQVQQVRLAQVDGSTAELMVQVRNTFVMFQQSAAMGQRLILKSQNATDNKLVYEWVY